MDGWMVKEGGRVFLERKKEKIKKNERGKKKGGGLLSVDR
jgi:hypothetical protein